MDPAQLDLDQYVPFYLITAANKLSSGASRIYLRRFGIGVNEWRLIANLRIRPGATAADICQESAIDKAVASRALKVLLDRGLVIGDVARDDARRRPMRLTDRGHALHDQILAVALARERALLAGFSVTDRQMLTAFLRRLNDNIRTMETSEFDDR